MPDEISELKRKIAELEAARVNQSPRPGGVPAIKRLIAFIVLAIIAAAALSNAHRSAPGLSEQTSSAGPTETGSVATLKGNSLEKGPELLLTNWSCHKEYGYMILEGEVQNISTERIENVEAVASYYTASGEFVKSDSSLAEYRPLLVGQRTPFKVMTTENPAIKKCNVAFKHFWGSEIKFEDAKSRRKSEAAARDDNPRLLEAQKLLTAMGYELGSVDGKMGPKTKAALQSYAQQEGLPFDGTLSDVLLGSLRTRQTADKQ